ncbi:MAG: hypothetical protein AB1427_11340 [Thermodesulfobacteriota bacterium]
MLVSERAGIKFRIDFMLKAISVRFRVKLAILLVLCLSPTVMTASWLDALHNLGDDSKPVLFISVYPSDVASGLAIRSRSRLPDSLDDLLKASLIPGLPLIVFARKTFSSRLKENDRIAHLFDSKIITVRAPPAYLYI